MKELIKNLLVFVALAFVISSLEGCTGTTRDINGTNTAAIKPANSGSSSEKSSSYPAIPSGVASAEIEALDGKITKVSDHKGKVLMVNLWGIWCGPCREEMPHLNQMQKQYADKGLEVISLNVGDQALRPEPVDNIKRFIEQMKLDYNIARVSNDSLSQFYMVSKAQAIPQTFLIDRDSHLRGVWVGGGQNVFNQLQQALDKTMNE